MRLGAAVEEGLALELCVELLLVSLNNTVKSRRH